MIADKPQRIPQRTFPNNAPVREAPHPIKIVTINAPNHSSNPTSVPFSSSEGVGRGVGGIDVGKGSLVGVSVGVVVGVGTWVLSWNGISKLMVS